MAEEIYVTYRHAYSPSTGDDQLPYHMAINYRDNAGNVHVIEAGPTAPAVPPNLAGAFINEEFNSTSNTDSPFGRLKSVPERIVGVDDPILTYPRETILSSEDLSATWATIQGSAAAVDAEGYEYRPLSQNSNTFVNNVLRRSGAPVASGNPTTGGVFLLAPGALDDLRNPIDAPSTFPAGPMLDRFGNFTDYQNFTQNGDGSIVRTGTITDAGVAHTVSETYLLGGGVSLAVNDGSGNPVSKYVFNADNTSDYTNLAASGTTPYSTITYHYDGAGQEIFQLGITSDGSRDYTVYDPYNQNSWSSYVDQFNSTGHKTARTIFADDGTKKVERYDRSANGYTLDVNTPDYIDFYDNAGTLLRTQHLLYTVIAGTESPLTLARIDTIDVANLYDWNSIVRTFGNDRSLSYQVTVRDDGLQGSYVDPTIFTSAWDFSSNIDSNQVLMATNPFSYYSQTQSTGQNLDIPTLASYDPLSYYATSDYEGYTASPFQGIANTDPFNNISLISSNPFDYFDFSDQSSTFQGYANPSEGFSAESAQLTSAMAAFNSDSSMAATSYSPPGPSQPSWAPGTVEPQHKLAA